MERHISWDRVARLAEQWGGPFAIKGLQSCSDARRSVDVGATAIIVSNHGGRQLDGGRATIELVADIVDAVDGRAEVILDGGIRRGTHLVKSIAMGASAVMIGRPYVNALAAFGRPGVARLLKNLKQETVRTLALLGCASIDDVGRDHIRLAEQVPEFLHSQARTQPIPSTRATWSPA
jgi:L-lactate dehydrogenase (cytochrome)